MNDWEVAAATVDKAILQNLAEVVCNQVGCENEDGSKGNCAFCHDCAENVIGKYLILTGQFQ